mmetsp:Transcript_23577/g.58761  ORF Transcript_23577/g.58761 Transcript_23577/m.58761 type:complete len:244 (+) Transcript_23577:908-1639(+)
MGGCWPTSTSATLRRYVVPPPLRKLSKRLQGVVRPQRLLDANRLQSVKSPVDGTACDSGRQRRRELLRQRLLQPQLDTVCRRKALHWWQAEPSFQAGQRTLDLPFGSHWVAMDDVVRLSPSKADAEQVAWPKLNTILNQAAAVVLPRLDRAQHADAALHHEDHLDQCVVNRDRLGQPIRGKPECPWLMLRQIRRDLCQAAHKALAEVCQLALIGVVGVPSHLCSVQPNLPHAEHVRVSAKDLL